MDKKYTCYCGLYYVIERFMLGMIKRNISKLFRLERSLAEKDNVLRFDEESPKKSWPDPDKIPNGEEVPFSLKNIPLVGLHLRSSVRQGIKAIETIIENPHQAKVKISAVELENFEDFAKESGIGAIGYAKLPPHLIFKERAVLYDSAVVLIMEMGKKAISKAPSTETFKMVMSTYATLGMITNRLTDNLRQTGFQAHASHPLGGLVLYPPLAVTAGLGWFGRHGLLITPQFGPRQRISAIFVNIDNLPFNKSNEHSWISEFCMSCGKCVESCPNGAILDQPIEHDSGRKTQIVQEKCIPIFVKQEGCTICIKECLFSTLNYHDIQEKFSAERK